MFGSTHLYEIHRHPTKDEMDAILLVRQGFSIWAFLFHVGWLLYHRLWIEGTLFLALYVGTVMIGERYDLSPVTIGLMQLALQFWLAVNASDIRAAALERKGFELVDVTTGTSELDAEHRYYYASAARI